MHVDRFLRRNGNEWVLTSADKPEESVRLESIEFDLRLADLYAKVEFSETALRPETLDS